MTSVTVQYGPGTSIILSPPDTIYTRTEGDPLPDITCTADCRPGCTFVWTRPDNTNFTVSPVLSLGQLDRSEHGTYRCTARNAVGESISTIIVTLQYGPGSSLILSPQETKYMRIKGDTLPDITCTADCRPGCTFVWTRPDNTNFTVSPVLSLGQLDRSEHGTYRCTASNAAGESTKVISVIVKYEPHPYQMLDQNQTYYLSQSDTIILSSTFISNPAPSFIWTFQPYKSFDATDLRNGTDTVIIQNTFEASNLTAISVLTRNSIQKMWFGLYNVTATNNQGSAMLSFTVREKLNPGIPTNLLIGCTMPHSVEVSWSDGGDSQYYHVMFSTDRFLNSQEVYPVVITKDTDGSDVYSQNIDNLDGGHVYFFKVVAYNKYGNTTSAETVGCTVYTPCSSGTDSMYVTGVVLAVTGVLTLLFTVGIGIYFRRNGRLCHRSRQLPKQKEYQDVQLSDRGGRSQSENERSPYQELDTNEVAKASVYSEIGGHHHVNPIVSDNEGDGGKYESLEGRSNPNVYEELNTTTSGNRETYINTTIACRN
ncbi:hemicentin-1-like isoform X1 [Pecten maximus]|uniref:hemicentin-1-like isoform X1 n=1 Tax=Pecten maximus TaxID=6579 RepID=UPI0014587100|nr:hemicentin-1-like isoform X1 [Pecten maximus]